ncbi:hypothetical protein OAV88_03825 [bacterium]|nr:hypothetical protein [bacterium]
MIFFFFLMNNGCLLLSLSLSPLSLSPINAPSIDVLTYRRIDCIDYKYLSFCFFTNGPRSLHT